MTNVYCSWTPTTRGYHTIKNDFLNCAIPCQLAVCEITIYHSVGYLSLLFAVDFVLPLDVPMMSGWTIPQNCFQLDHHQYWQRRHEIFLEYLQTKHMQRGIWTILQETTGDRVARVVMVACLLHLQSWQWIVWKGDWGGLSSTKW